VIDVGAPEQGGRVSSRRLRDRQASSERSPLVAELVFEEAGQEVLFGNLTPIDVVNAPLT
jgi:hypothetical protein